ncbi:flagellar biosynthetic protein FliQ [Pseudooceanicola sp. C21-150M6]|uniref:flagellar biosynthetic protein FliQ n=1 Tax=Pseudooceanicola sp. C21-150M6 TaxID=3434355 RepID=UPI003D7F372F
MTEADAYDILSQTFLTVLIASAPILAVALAVGLFIAFFQALTQIQEMTLTFVPKIAAIFAVLLIGTPLMYSTVRELAEKVFDLIASGSV